MILIIFVSDFDNNEEALQGENVENDECVEGEVDRHVSPRTINSCCVFNIEFTKDQFYYLPNGPTDTCQNYSKIVHQPIQ